MRASKLRKRRKQPIIVKGIVGKVDTPTGGHVYSTSIMMRELQRLLAQVKQPHVVSDHSTGKHVLGVNVFAVIVDESNFVSKRGAPVMNEQRDDVSPLLALAEAAATKSEILTVIGPLADAAFRDSAVNGDSVGKARARITHRLNNYLTEHYFSFDGIGRKKTVDKIVKRLLKGYQQRHRQFEREIDHMRRWAEKHGEGFNRSIARRAAARIVWPEFTDLVEED